MDVVIRPDERILAYAPHLRRPAGATERHRCGVAPGVRLKRQPLPHSRAGIGTEPEIIERSRPASRAVAERLLGVIDVMEYAPDRPRGVRAKFHCAGFPRRELEVSPPLGAVHVHNPLGRPDPVILPPPRDLPVFPVHDVGQPFHA